MAIPGGRRSSRCSGSLRWPTPSIASQGSAKPQPRREILTKKIIRIWHKSLKSFRLDISRNVYMERFKHWKELPALQVSGKARTWQSEPWAGDKVGTALRVGSVLPELFPTRDKSGKIPGQSRVPVPGARGPDLPLSRQIAGSFT
ncbi:hypothetical protein HGM15179_011260 [Zosterops borbonicus]|uniref:Uncharacterized protein n=1 Tax=Zosterops borbonicus TaxID=364589 RepID=A0A8K1GCI8_9PASS|nr:hypothetical protein HGM15179_011260 [Zosterops borbonicus]